jgi:hypothetical protein
VLEEELESVTEQRARNMLEAEAEAAVRSTGGMSLRRTCRKERYPTRSSP